MGFSPALDFRESETSLWFGRGQKCNSLDSILLEIEFMGCVQVLPPSPTVLGAHWRRAGMHFEEFQDALNQNPGMG